MNINKKLNKNPFNTQNGLNYRESEVIDKSEVSKYFTSLGYKVIQIEQLWRHAHGQLEKNNKKYFFKMASTPGVAERTKNEVEWNKQIHEKIIRSDITYFDVPIIYETGLYNDKFYYLTDAFNGKLLSTKYPPSTNGLEKWLNNIVRANIFLISLNDLVLPRDNNVKNIVDNWDESFSKIEELADSVNKKYSQDLLSYAVKLKDTFIPSVNHGDFVPWHMINNGKKFILVDGEHASNQSPKYYDVCYFYHRLYTSGKSPKLAKKYLNYFLNELPQNLKNEFIKSIIPILAVRTIGGFWDAKNDKSDINYHKLIKDDLLTNNILK
jgi:hypothetical protein